MSGAISLGTAVAIGAGVGAIGIGAGLYESSQQQGIQNRSLGMAETTQQEQQQYNYQLQQLMANPSSFLQSPIFQSSLNQGLQGVQRQTAAGGYNLSGNQLTALQQYGQSQAAGQLQGQESILASLSGLQSATSTGQSLGIASQAQSQSFNQLGSVLAALGYSTNTSSPFINPNSNMGGTDFGASGPWE